MVEILSLAQSLLESSRVFLDKAQAYVTTGTDSLEKNLLEETEALFEKADTCNTIAEQLQTVAKSIIEFYKRA